MALKRMRPKKMENDFVIDEFLDNTSNKLPFPTHMVILGPTQSGKSFLIGKILDQISDVYIFNRALNGKQKMIVISPIQDLEIADIMSNAGSWDISLYPSQKFDERLVLEIKDQFEKSDASIKILLVDDFLLKAVKNVKHLSLLNEIYSYFRHLNICIVSTLHAYDNNYKNLIQQAGVIICMYGPSIIGSLRRILTPYFFQGTADLVRKLQRCYINHMTLHNYIVLNNTKESMASELFYITNNIFNPKSGLTIQQLFR